MLQRFPNAYHGVSKLHTAEILELIGGILAVIALVLLAVSQTAPETGIGVGIGALVVLAAMLVMIVTAAILKLIGLAKARVDEPAFGTALIFVIIGAAASLLGAALSRGESGKLISDIGNDVANVCSLCVSIYVVQGIINLANKLGDAGMVVKGMRFYKLLIATYAVALAASIVATVFSQTDAGSAVAVILAIVAAVLDVVAYVFLFVYIGKAKQMLA